MTVMRLVMLRRKPPQDMSEEEKARHPSWRRYTRKYQKKRRLVRDVWIITGLLMLSVPLSIILVLAMATTFLAFMILDEVP